MPRPPAAQSRSIARPQALPPFVRRQDTRFQYARHRLAAARLRPDGREGVRRPETLVGLVKDLPVHQLPAPAEADAARSHAAQRKRDHAQLPPAKAPRILHGGVLRAVLSDAVRGLPVVRCLALSLFLRERVQIADLRDRSHRAGGLLKKIPPIQLQLLRHDASLSTATDSQATDSHAPAPARKRRAARSAPGCPICALENVSVAGAGWLFSESSRYTVALSLLALSLPKGRALCDRACPEQG